MSTLAAVLGTLATRKVLLVVWNAVRGPDAPEPPLNPADRSVSWPDALAWAVAAGVGAGIGRLVGQRLAAEAWEVATGDTPPGIEG